MTLLTFFHRAPVPRQAARPAGQPLAAAVAPAPTVRRQVKGFLLAQRRDLSSSSHVLRAGERWATTVEVVTR